MRKLGKLVAKIAPDTLVVAGTGAMAYGAHEIFRPSGYILAGLVAFAVGVLAARNERTPK